MSRLWKVILFGCLVGFAGLLASPFRFTLGMEEDIGLGLLFKLRGALQAPRDVVVISIDRESSEQLGIPDNPDKWPRSLHARLTETLAREGAKVVSFDLHFIEPRVAKDDAVFAEAMKKARNVVLTEPIRTKDMPLPDGDGSSESPSHSIVKVVPPIELFSNAAVATAPFTLPRIPFKVARFFTFEPGAGDAPSVPMVMLQLYCANVYEDFIRLLEKASPDQAGKVPHGLSAAIASGSVRDLMRKIRGIFQGDPAIGERMRKELERSKEIAGDPERSRLVRVLIRLY